jgi:hypothetical protein
MAQLETTKARQKQQVSRREIERRQAAQAERHALKLAAQKCSVCTAVIPLQKDYICKMTRCPSATESTGRRLSKRAAHPAG